MSYTSKTLDEIKQIIQTYFTAAGFENIEPGTPEHALMNMFSNVVYNLNIDITDQFNSLMPLDAAGSSLDLWASFFGAERTLPIIAEDTSYFNVYFYISEENRSSVDSGSEVVIPLGTAISDANGSRSYTTTAEVTIPDVAPYVAFVPVVATSTGAFLNVAEREITVHRFTGLTSTENALIEVSNKFAIVSGGLQQNDSELQMKLQDIFGEHIGTNYEGILASVYAIPGVSNVTLLPAKRGTGTFNVFIDSTSPIVTPLLITSAQNVVDKEAALGVTGYVEYPVYKAITLVMDVMPKEGVVAATLLADLESNTIITLMDTVNNIARGETFDPLILQRIILDHEDVLSAQIKELRIGEYSILEDKILNNLTVNYGRKRLTEFDKWFTSTDLISFCVIDYE